MAEFDDDLDDEDVALFDDLASVQFMAAFDQLVWLDDSVELGGAPVDAAAELFAGLDQETLLFVAEQLSTAWARLMLDRARADQPEWSQVDAARAVLARAGKVRDETSAAMRSRLAADGERLDEFLRGLTDD